MDSISPVSLSATSTTTPAILIRAPLTSIEDDEDIDIDTDVSPYVSDAMSEGKDEDDYETAESDGADEIAELVFERYKGGALMRSSSMPVAPLTSDDDFVDEEMEDEDELFGVVKVQNLNLGVEGEVIGAVEELAGCKAEGEKDDSLVSDLQLGAGNDDDDIVVVKIDKDSNGRWTLKNEILTAAEDLTDEHCEVDISTAEEKEAEEDEFAAQDDNEKKLAGENLRIGPCYAVRADTADAPLFDAHDAVIGEALHGSENLKTVEASGNVDSEMDHNVTKEKKNKSDADESATVELLEGSDSYSSKQIADDLNENSFRTQYASQSINMKYSDGEIALDSDEEIDSDDEDEKKTALEDAIAALFKAASTTSDESVNSSSNDVNAIFSLDHSAALESSAPLHETATKHNVQSNPSNSSDLHRADVPGTDMTEEEKKLLEKVEQLRVKFLRLVHKLGHSPEDSVAAQVLYRLNLAEGIRHGRPTNRAFNFEYAKKKALQLEAEGKDLDFSCNILVLGKCGVGKSATINSIFGGEKSRTDAFNPATISAKEFVGNIDGVKIRFIDAPGLRISGLDQSLNRSILSSVKKYVKKFPPDIVLYVDRLDVQTRDISDLTLLKAITNILGSSIWFNAIVALTHADSGPPDEPNGSPMSLDMLVAQRSHVIQQSIRLAAGDMRLMNPVALVENHTACRRNSEGHRVLSNGMNWCSKLMLLCYSSKILSEANSLLKFQDPSPRKSLDLYFRSPPLPLLLSSLLQSRMYPKLPTDQGGEKWDSDMDLDEFSDADQNEDEYDQLPPFKPLSKSQLASLTEDQRNAYFDEYDYRVKLLEKKQWKEETRRLKEKKKKDEHLQNDFITVDMSTNRDQDDVPASVPVPLPDLVLPPSFDSDMPTYRYRFLEPLSQFIVRPVLDAHAWDHDCGFDAVSLEENLVLGDRFPATISAQISKDKKEFKIHLDSSISAKLGENASYLAGFDIQAVGKQLAYILRSDAKFKNLKKNKIAGGVSLTFLGETIASGIKIEDQLSIGRRGNLVGSVGVVRGQGDTVCGANLEARLQDKDYPIGQTLMTLGLSLMIWQGDLALGTNFQSQFSVGRSKLAVRLGVNNKLSGQITMRMNTSEQLQVALLGIIPVVFSLIRGLRTKESDAYASNYY